MLILSNLLALENECFLHFSKLVPQAIFSECHDLVTKNFWTKEFNILGGHHKVIEILEI